MRRLLAVAVLLLMSAACSDDTTPMPEKLPVPDFGERLPGGALATPLTFHEVVKETPGPCESSGKRVVEDTAAGSCLELAEPDFKVSQTLGVRKVQQQGSWGLELELVDQDAHAFKELTSRLVDQGPPRNRVAPVLAGRHLVVAPIVQQPITDGRVMLAGTFDEDDVDSLLNKLRG